MPFVSTVTGGESKSRSFASKLTSTGNALMFDRKKSHRMTADGIEKRASTQLNRIPDLEENEKRRILEDAGKVRHDRSINVDSYIANIIGKKKDLLELGQPRTGHQPRSSLQMMHPNI